MGPRPLALGGNWPEASGVSRFGMPGVWSPFPRVDPAKPEQGAAEVGVCSMLLDSCGPTRDRAVSLDHALADACGHVEDRTNCQG
jgi:hypothetical protein